MIPLSVFLQTGIDPFSGAMTGSSSLWTIFVFLIFSVLIWGLALFRAPFSTVGALLISVLIGILYLHNGTRSNGLQWFGAIALVYAALMPFIVASSLKGGGSNK